MLNALVNVLSVVHAHAYFPCHSNGLKDVGGCLGCSWTDQSASGLQSIVWRKRSEAGHAEEWKKYGKLTERERAVLHYVASGFTAPEIGEKLLISAKTVDTYKQRINQKLSLSHRSDYVAFALKLGLLE